MSKRKNPSTSIDAYKSLDPASIRQIYKDILWTLGQMPGGATYEELATAMKIKESRVWKRLGEMESMGLIHRNGRKTLSSGRAGSIWKVLKKGARIVMPDKIPPGKTVQDFSRAIHQVGLSSNIQAKLF